MLSPDHCFCNGWRGCSSLVCSKESCERGYVGATFILAGSTLPGVPVLGVSDVDDDEDEYDNSARPRSAGDGFPCAKAIAVMESSVTGDNECQRRERI